MSGSVKAHGLDGTLVKPDWPPLILREARAVLTEFSHIAGPFEIVTASPRPFSAASVIATRDMNVFLKRHSRAVRTAEALREEHRFIAHLRGHDASVPEVFRTRDDDTVVEMGSSIYELHSVPDGVDLYEDAISWTPFVSAAHARSAGETMALLHLAAESYSAPSRSRRPLVASFTIFAAVEPLVGWDAYVRHRPALKDYLDRHGLCDRALELLAPFHAEITPLLPHLQPLWTHNDLHPSNFFWSDATAKAHATAVIDFGLCDRTNAVHDLAHAIERSVVEWLALMQHPQPPEAVFAHTEHLWALLDGYNSARPLTAAERASLAPMLALCHAEFALSEAEYFLTVLHSEEKARVACEDYLIAHAAWWRTAGAPVLDSIRAWASAPNSRNGARLQ